MRNVEKLDLLEISLERAAEQLGDVTPHVFEAYYREYPEARGRFDDLYPNGRAQLEGEMVAQVLFCLMEWYASQIEIEIILLGTVPHHIETLRVPSGMFLGLIEAVTRTIIATIPESAASEHAVWKELSDAIQSVAIAAALRARQLAA